MKDKYFITPIITFLLLVSVSSALTPVPGWETQCLNTTHIFKSASIQYNDGTTSFNNNFNQTLQCPFGCDTRKDVCHKWPGDAIPSEYYFLFLVFALLMFSFMVFRLGVKQKEIQPYDLIFSLIALGMFIILALQGNNVIDASTGEAVQITMVVWYCFGFAGLSVAVFFFNLYKLMDKGLSGNE